MRQAVEPLQTPVCSGCGHLKTSVNSWWAARKMPSGELVLMPFSEVLRAGEYHLCGMSCVQLILNEYMTDAINAEPARQDQFAPLGSEMKRKQNTV